MKEKLLRRAIATLVLIGALISFTPAAPASAEPSCSVLPPSSTCTGDYLQDNDNMAFSGTKILYSVSSCIDWSFQATLQYTPSRSYVLTGGYHYFLKNVSVYDPLVRIKSYKLKADGTCDRTRGQYLSSLRIVSKLRASSCSYNPAIQVALPWQVGFSFWPSCGSEYMAYLDTTAGVAWTYRQYNSGARVFVDSMADLGLSTRFPSKSMIRCYSFSAALFPTLGGTSDGWDIPPQTICPTPSVFNM